MTPERPDTTALLARAKKPSEDALRLHPFEERQATFADKWRVCPESNGEHVVGGIAEALRGADVCVARTMARDAVVFACANPVPEIWPWDAKQAGARVVATGRSDFPNQLNNSLVFPGLFRGALDDILPRMDEWDVHLRVAVAAATEAQAQGVARVAKSRAEIHDAASRCTWNARETTRLLMRAGLIRDMPSEGA